MLNEFNIIEKYFKPLALNNQGSLKLSDDIFFDKKKHIAVSVDTYTEGLHFLYPSKPNFFEYPDRDLAPLCPLAAVPPFPDP